MWTPPAAQASLRLEQVPRWCKAPPPVCCTQTTAVTGVMGSLGFAVSCSVSHQWPALHVLPALGNADSWFLPASCGFGTGWWQDVSYGHTDWGCPSHTTPPPHTHTLLQRSHNFQLWVPVGFAVGFLCSREKCWAPPAPDPQGLVIMAPAPSFHLGRNLRPLSSQLLPEAVASLLELTLPFDFLLLLLMNWGVSPKKTCGVLIPVPQEEGLIWK